MIKVRNLTESLEKKYSYLVEDIEGEGNDPEEVLTSVANNEFPDAEVVSFKEKEIRDRSKFYWEITLKFNDGVVVPILFNSDNDDLNDKESLSFHMGHVVETAYDELEDGEWKSGEPTYQPEYLFNEDVEEPISEDVDELIRGAYHIHESWEEEFNDEYDYIMDDDSLSDNEKARQVKLLRQKYNKKNESLNEDTNKKYIVITRGGFIGGNDLNGTLFDSKEEARAACTEWKKSFGKNRSYYKPQTSIYVYKPGGVFDDAKNYHDERIKDESLNESFVEEWWGQTDEDPFDFAYDYGLTCAKIGRRNDEVLYRFTGSKEDIEQAIKDGYFYSMSEGEDEGHSEDLDESLTTKTPLTVIKGLTGAATGAAIGAEMGHPILGAASGLAGTLTGDVIWDKYGHKDDDEDNNESLNESIAGDIIWEKVRDIIREKIETEIIDNLAMVISSEVPEYNPDWCAESSNQSQWAADKLAEELATELMFELE